MGNEQFRDAIKPKLDNGHYGFIKIMSDGGDRLHDGTNHSNEIGHLFVDGYEVLQKVMLTSHKYHQRRKALTEMVSAWLDEGLGGQRVVPLTYAGAYSPTPTYNEQWGPEAKEGRVRVCQVVHEYLTATAGDVWRGEVYRAIGNLAAADEQCKAVIEAHPDAERIALLDFLTINQDRSARNWITDHGHRFYAIDNGMAWFHEYPEGDGWRIGCVIDDVLLQKGPWRFISGVFTTSYAGRGLSALLAAELQAFNWPLFCQRLNRSCGWLGLPRLSNDWRFLGLKRRLEWIRDKGRMPRADEYRGWFAEGSDMFTPPEIVASGGEIVWIKGDDRA